MTDEIKELRRIKIEAIDFKTAIRSLVIQDYTRTIQELPTGSIRPFRK